MRNFGHISTSMARVANPHHHNNSLFSPTPSAPPPPSADLSCPSVLPRGGYGGHAAADPAPDGHSKGGGTQTRTSVRVARRGFRVGDEVRNCGAGVWGFGTIVAIIPASVNPRWYCRRHKLPLVFSAKTEAVWEERYIVKCDDGRYHAPRKLEGV